MLHDASGLRHLRRSDMLDRGSPKLNVVRSPRFPGVVWPSPRMWGQELCSCRNLKRQMFSVRLIISCAAKWIKQQISIDERVSRHEPK